MTIPPNSPVLIVGAGPVGLSLAVALIAKGIPVRVFERDAELSSAMRANTIHPRTLEMFAEWGVLDDVLAHGHRVGRLQYWERSTRTFIAEFDYARIAADTPYPFRLQCPQHILTRVLKPIVQASPLGEVCMNHRFVEMDGTDAQTVVAHFQTPDGIIEAAGSYLCGADGGRSAVREHLGIGFEGMTYEDRFLLIGTDLDLASLFPGIGPVNYMFDPDEWVIVLNLPDMVRFSFRLRSDENEVEATSEQALRARVAGFLGTEKPFEIRSRQVYRVHQRVAERFRADQALLLGDAAHINNPAGDMGMNNGIHDAYYLAQALAEPSEHSLNDYANTRKRVAVQSVQAYTHQLYADMVVRDEAARMARNHRLRATAADPEEARNYLLRVSMLNA